MLAWLRRLLTGEAVDADPELTRRWLARAVILLLTLIVVAIAGLSTVYSFDCWYYGDDGRCTRAKQSIDDLVTSIQPIFTALIGLVGSVIGFYFGSREGDTGRRPPTEKKPEPGPDQGTDLAADSTSPAAAI